MSKVDEKVWVAEHSNIQDCYHVDMLDYVMQRNIENVLRPWGSDYQILFMGKFEECHQFIRNLQEIKCNKKNIESEQ